MIENRTIEDVNADDCPGPGLCHGSASWCDRCGDVDDVCDAPVCYRHRCRYCSEIFSFGEREFLFETEHNIGDGYCFDCYVRVAVLDARDHGDGRTDRVLLWSERPRLSR